MADELIALFGKITTNDHEQLVDQFSKIMQVDPHVSNFFLEASSWNVETAVHNYLASQQGLYARDQQPLPLTSPPQAVFTSDLAPWQSRPFQGGTKLPIHLRFQNTGTAPWPADTYLIFVDGEIMGAERGIGVQAAPGEVVEVVLVLTVPPNEGTHMGSWRLACSAGYFGEPVYMIVNSHHAAPPVQFAPSEFHRPSATQQQEAQHEQAQFDQLMSLANNSLRLGHGQQNDHSMGDN